MMVICLKIFWRKAFLALGIEPTESTANATIRYPNSARIFGEGLAKKLASDRQQADLIVANNVFAHIPDVKRLHKGNESLIKAKRHDYIRVSASNAFNS